MAAAGEMASLDEALSAMLSNDHGQYSSLASVMTSSNSPCAGTGDLFASQYSSLHDRLGHGVAATSTTRTSTYMADAEWPFPREEKWVLDAKRESVQVSSGLASGHGHAPPSGGLQRYHSAPSSFLQCLADFNVDTFSQVPDSPLGDIGEATLLNSFLAENLAPIQEKGSQPMDTGKPDASPSLNDYERFFLSQNNFGRNGAYISPSGKSDPCPPSILQDHSHSGVHSTPDSLGVRSRPTRSKILRQSSSPADFLAAVHDHMDESKSPIFKTPSFLPTDENMTSPNPEENAAGRLGHGSRVLETDFPGWLGSSSPKGPKLGGLIRHSSLPVASRPFSPPRDLDDLADLGAVPFKTRAGRGFATHPRSIAERVRRTKISERMKKLQDLVPNMDRQTNTADMLDEAVEYVKQLQLQVQELSNTVVQLKENLAHCT